MGNGSSYRIKRNLYITVFVVVMLLFVVRVYNAVQRTNYGALILFTDIDVEVSLNYPKQILSPKNDVSYPLTLAFTKNNQVLPSISTYKVILQSPTLLFVDSKGAQVPSEFQFASNSTFIETSIYIRPYLSDIYPRRHVIFAQVLVDGTPALVKPLPIEIQTEPLWFSFFSLTTASLLEVSLVAALVAWIINAVDAGENARKEQEGKRKEQEGKIRDELNDLSALPYLAQMKKVIALKKEADDNHLSAALDDEIERKEGSFSEKEFCRALSDEWRQDTSLAYDEFRTLHTYFFPVGNYKDSMDALGEIIHQISIPQDRALTHISCLMKWWDDFDADARDLVVGALSILSEKSGSSQFSPQELWEDAFKHENRRRLLRDVQIQTIFPQLVDPKTGKPNPIGYRAWSYPAYSSNDETCAWLEKKFSLASNPFGANNFAFRPFYPTGFARPDQWEEFQSPVPQYGQCPLEEDTKALTILMRAEGLPRNEDDRLGMPERQIFPVMVAFEQIASPEPPLAMVTRSAAQAWMDVLASSPDAMLDLPPLEQAALMELLVWAFGSTGTAVNYLKRAGAGNGVAERLLTQKISEFKPAFSPTHLPSNAILISWLKLRPPDLAYTYLIVSVNEIPASARSWWLEHFILLIPTLFENGIVAKVFSSSQIPAALPLSTISLNWSDAQLKTSLASQFDAAMDRDTRKGMGKIIDFRSLFGYNASVGYFETDEATTDKLVNTSCNSLARMLKLGTLLLKNHDKQDGFLFVVELDAILETA